MEKLEVEKKFLLAKIRNLPLRNGEHVAQGYLDFQNDEKVEQLIKDTFGVITFPIEEVRVRNKAGKHSVTIKSKGELQRLEVEAGIEKEVFDHYWLRASRGKIFKIRYCLNLGHNLVYEIDKYLENLIGLYTAEVEYDPKRFTEEEISLMVKKATPNAIEVTQDSAFKNKSLALMKDLRGLELQMNHKLYDLETAYRISKILTP